MAVPRIGGRRRATDATGNEASAVTDYLPGVRHAAEAIKPYVVRTPLVYSSAFSGRLGFPAYLKLENLQVTGAFKIRGAMNRMLALREAGVKRVVAASSGSHAMGVALAARICGLEATIVMSEASPALKRQKVLAYGANLLVRGPTFDDAYRVGLDTAHETGAEFVSGIEDEMVMAGHGTMGLEILEDLPEVDFVAIPVGGGGAISGLLMALKEERPAIEVWGVQADGAPSMKVSLERDEVVTLPTINTVADAIAVRKPGAGAFRIVKERVNGIATASDEEMLRNVGRLALWDKVVAEAASAAPLAVDWVKVLGRKPKAAVFIVTGGNVARDLLLKAIGMAEEAA